MRVFTGATIRYGWDGKPFCANSRGLLIGDAVGLADPISGEGIGPALLQSRMAAGVIWEYVNRQIASIAVYNRLLRETFQAETICAERLSAFLYRFPRLSRTLLQMRGQSILEGFIQVTVGRKTYRQQFNRRLLAAKLSALPLALLKNRL